MGGASSANPDALNGLNEKTEDTGNLGFMQTTPWHSGWEMRNINICVTRQFNKQIGDMLYLCICTTIL